MNYQRIYEQLTARDMIADYTEEHHIIPECIGGTNDPSNLVFLTPEAHYVAHQLLVKIYPTNDKLVFAANMMTVDSNGKRVNNKRYGWLKRKHAAAMSKLNKGRTHSDKAKSKISKAHKGKILSAETKAKMSASKKGKITSAETKAKISTANKGKVLSAERRSEISIAHKGKILSAETKAKISASHKGKTLSHETRTKLSMSKQHISDETRAKMSAAQKGKTLSDSHKAKLSIIKKQMIIPKAICPHCGKEGAAPQMKQWHFDKCKYQSLFNSI